MKFDCPVVTAASGYLCAYNSKLHASEYAIRMFDCMKYDITLVAWCMHKHTRPVRFGRRSRQWEGVNSMLHLFFDPHAEVALSVASNRLFRHLQEVSCRTRCVHSKNFLLQRHLRNQWVP